MAEAWNAKWISYAYDPRQDLGVFAFRRRFSHASQIRVSADNRYKLYCNGKLVGMGPQRGDARHWFYETYDLTPFLVDGENELIALVWNFGWMAPMAQHTVRTGFVLEDLLQPKAEEPLTPQGESLSTPQEWEVARVDAWSFDMMHSGVGEFYIDIGPGENVDFRRLPLSSMNGGERGLGGEGRSVQTSDLRFQIDDLDWQTPHVICTAEDRGANGGGTPWMLIPATLPQQRYSELPLSASGSFRGEGVGGWGDSGRQLYEFGELLCAYPRITFEGPRGAEVRITYAESLWVPGTDDKGNRNEIEGKEIRGYQDRVILSGGIDVFEPLWWRTFRFIQIEQIELTPPPSPLPASGEGEVPLTPQPPLPRQCHRGEGEFGFKSEISLFQTGYPYEVESSFEADHPWVRPIWEVSVRTADRCAGETYFDCPYYEQLQYVGDARIQALIGYYLGRDRRLQRNSIDQIGWSIMENGLTQSRYPSRQTQVIPPFSLWWVMMLYDQMLYDDVPYTNERAGQVSRVLDGFCGLTEQQGGAFWNFGDWVPGWRWGVPPGGVQSRMHQLLYMLAHAAQHALTGAELRDLGDVLREWCDFQADWMLEISEPRIHGLLGSDAPSEHVEALWRCLQSMVGLSSDAWPRESLESAAKCTYYFGYYKHLAVFASPPPNPLPARQTTRGEGEFSYLEELRPWFEQIENGLTTFAENPEPTRSDCHAWSAHPILGFFQIIAGVTSTAPGWKKVKIAPQPFELKRFDARVAHPDGELRVAYENDRLRIDTPVEAHLFWKGREALLPPGPHRIS
ncbi:MAG: family 78 glycoside hydrolase catalytic domain [Methanoregulaceae archaeon]|nr:family 78 glycoside hydrolase catalytic domain [Methanoregulaceae archaeon]